MKKYLAFTLLLVIFALIAFGDAILADDTIPTPIHYCTPEGIALDFGYVNAEGTLTIRAFERVWQFETPAQVVIQTGIKLFERDTVVYWEFIDRRGRLHAGNKRIPVSDVCISATPEPPEMPQTVACAIMVDARYKAGVPVVGAEVVVNGLVVGYTATEAQVFPAPCGEKFVQVGKDVVRIKSWDKLVEVTLFVEELELVCEGYD